MTIIRVGNSIEEIKETIEKLRASWPTMAYISYAGGELGLIGFFYQTMISRFVRKQRELGNLVVGFCLKGSTSYLKPIADIIIEMNDIVFSDTPDKTLTGGYDHRTNKADGPLNSAYFGINGWDEYYIKGIRHQKYEELIDSFGFSNIFYTINSDGGTFFTKCAAIELTESGDGRPMNVGKINNEPLIFGSNWLKVLEGYGQIYTTRKKEKSNKICLFLRNTNKDPSRNITKEFYETIFNYCISNKINLYVIQDFMRIDLPISPYIEEFDSKESGKFSVDKIIDFVQTCYIFVGAESGISELISYYTDTNILMTCKSKPVRNNPSIYQVGCHNLVSTLELLYK
jgi:hypothetical protein